MTEIKLLENYRPLFAPPETRYFILTGGRGSAKSWHVSFFLSVLTNESGHVILYTRYTLTSAHISIIPEFLEKIELLNNSQDFEVTKTEIINHTTGSRILFRGIKTSSGNQTASLKSIQGVTTWVLDEAEELLNEDNFDTIDLSIRAKNMPNRVIMVMNPSHREHFIYKRWFGGEKRADTTYIHTTYLDNEVNLSQSFLDQANRTKEANILRYQHLFLGDWTDSADGLLWTKIIINRFRIETAPELKRIVIAIDPAVTANKKSDETGITVQGIDHIGNGYFLEDLSGKFTPNEWGVVAVQAAKRWGAACIVAEVNQGGDMVENVIRQIDKTIRYKGVRATKGKYTRAEPIFNLYEQGKIYHVGNHPILELQMCTFNPNEGDSPDRVDALVWGFTELMIKPAKTVAFA